MIPDLAAGKRPIVTVRGLEAEPIHYPVARLLHRILRFFTKKR